MKLAIFYMHQTSGAFAGMSTFDHTHQMEKSALVTWRSNQSSTFRFELLKVLVADSLSEHIIHFKVGKSIEYGMGEN